jgi:hypothetical protein
MGGRVPEQSRRPLARAGTWVLLTLALLTAGGSLAAPTLRYSVDQRGDMLIIGNTLGHECNSAAAPIVPASGVQNNNATCGTNRTDSGIDVLWRADAPSAGTATESAAATESAPGKPAPVDPEAT